MRPWARVLVFRLQRLGHTCQNPAGSYNPLYLTPRLEQGTVLYIPDSQDIGASFASVLCTSWVPRVTTRPQVHPCHDSPACFESELPVSSRHNCSRSSASCKERKPCSPEGPHQNPQGMTYEDSPKTPSTTLHARAIKTSPKIQCS